MSQSTPAHAHTARRSGSSAPAVHVMHVVYSLRPGGMEYGVVKLANGLEGTGVRTSICSTTPADPAMAARLRPSVILVELRRRKGNDPLLVGRLYRVFRQGRPDIVHTHGWGTLLEGMVAARLARVPAVIHGEHGTLQLKPRQAKAQRWAWRRADKLLAVSRRLAERMASEVGIPPAAVSVIPNGVDLARFSTVDRGSARGSFGLSGDVMAIGHAGRLVEVKDQASLVEAAARLKADGLSFRVLIAGEGPLRAALESQISAHGLADHVRLLGHVPDIERFYAALDVFVLCSRSEGMPNTILEAMAAGVSVIATRVGGADELVVDGTTGFLIPPGRPDSLASSLETLARNQQQRVALGAAGRSRAVQEFSVGGMLDSYRTLYLGARPGTRAAQR